MEGSRETPSPADSSVDKAEEAPSEEREDEPQPEVEKTNASDSEPEEGQASAQPELDVAAQSEQDSTQDTSAQSEQNPEQEVSQKGEAQPESLAPAPPARKFTTMLLAEGIVKYGAIALVESGSAEDSEVDPNTDSAGLLGAQATLGLMPGGSTFMLAGRLRAGTYIRTAEAIPNLGAEVLFGANFYQKEDGRSFSYVLGGMGVEYMPTNNQDLLMLHAVGGSVVRGLDLGGGITIGANDEFAVFMFGLHLGWGRIFY